LTHWGISLSCHCAYTQISGVHIDCWYVDPGHQVHGAVSPDLDELEASINQSLMSQPVGSSLVCLSVFTSNCLFTRCDLFFIFLWPAYRSGEIVANLCTFRVWKWMASHLTRMFLGNFFWNGIINTAEELLEHFVNTNCYCKCILSKMIYLKIIIFIL